MSETCVAVGDEAHVLFRSMCRLARPSTGVVKATRDNLYERLCGDGYYDQTSDEFRYAFLELLDAGIVDRPKLYDWNQILIHGWCRCDALAPRTGVRTHVRAANFKQVIDLASTDLEPRTEVEAGVSEPLRGSSHRQRRTKPIRPNGVYRPRRLDDEGNPIREGFDAIWIPADITTWHAAHLAHYFREQMMAFWFGQTPGEHNMKALGGQIGRWIHKEGIRPEHVKVMIDYFVSDRRMLSPTVPAWKSFIHFKSRLYEAAVATCP